MMNPEIQIDYAYYVNVAELTEQDIDFMSETLNELPIIKEGYREC